MREAKSERNGPNNGPLKMRATGEAVGPPLGAYTWAAFLWAVFGLGLAIFRVGVTEALLAYAVAFLALIAAEIRKAAQPVPETVSAVSVQDARRESRRERSQRRTRCLEAMAVGARVGDSELHKLASVELEAIQREAQDQDEAFIQKALDDLHRVM